jgi:hypothetical protein
MTGRIRSGSRKVLEMFRIVRTGLVTLVAVAVVACATTTFQSTWSAPGAKPLNFAGKKVVALVMSKDDSVRFPAEDALAREITARGAVGVAAYTAIPKEIIQDKERAKAILDKEGVAGVVALRVVGKEQQITSTPGTYWGGPGYATFWGAGYWGAGWGGVYSSGYLQTDTLVSVETLIYSLAQDKLVWAGRSQTTNPSNVGPFIKELVGAAAGKLKEQGLIK